MYGKFKEACGVIGIYGNKEDAALNKDGIRSLA